ncbi:Sensor histidine kinase TmoS [Planctomyces sp. SH-PL14]|nr:Sensor histidine kinase TmoS [Planctomyces sp. SH-PL14]
MTPDESMVPISSVAHGSEMADRTRRFDWSRTPVGPMAAWPQSLRTAVQILLDSRYAMWLGWGPDFTFFYNDAYGRMTLGPKHPWALGRPTREVWSEIWADVGPRAESVLKTGQATWDEGLLLFLERNGFPEETYHTFSYSPVLDDQGRIGGMLCVVTEDTERTIAERRLRTLRELGSRVLGSTQSVESACEASIRILEGNPYDVAFSLLYLAIDGGAAVTLAGSTGLPGSHRSAPQTIVLSDPEAPWPLAEVRDQGKAVEVTDLVQRFGPLPCGAWPEPPQRALVLPLARPGQTAVAGYLVAGISPRRPLDDGYRGFLDILAGQITNAVADARAYEEERQRAEALAELDRAKTTFFSNISHEFRTPLTLMLGPVSDLLQGEQGELAGPVREQLDLVQRNGTRLLRLVNAILDFARIEAGRNRSHFQPTDLARQTAELGSVFRSAVERAGLRLVVDCPPLAEPVYVDRDMWEKIVLNLLSNAFKFTFAGEIALSLRREGESVVLRVRDTGTGIPAEELPKLFDRFHRVENARGRTHEGSGIGLALVQELVKQHHGTVSAESEFGAGTTFVVRIPLGRDHLPADHIGPGTDERGHGPSTAASFVEEALHWSDPAEPAGLFGDPAPESEPRAARDIPAGSGGGSGSTHRPRVLIADDNSDMRQYLVRLLSDLYEVEAVSDGEAALQRLRRRPPRLVLSDVMMPRLDGFGLLKAIRDEPATRELPVILLSARAGEESRVEGMGAGADDYLVKPFSARELLARVHAHLQMSQVRHEAHQVVRESEERLRLGLKAARMLAWEWVPATDEVTLSANAAEVLGLPGPQKIHRGNQGANLVHPEDRAAHDRDLQEAIARCEAFVCQFRMIRPDTGETIWVEEHGQPVPGPDGRTERLIGVLMDITPRKAAELAFRKEREWLKVTLSSIGDAVVATDNDGRVIFLNGVAESLTGWEPQEAHGRPLEEIFPIINEGTRRPVENPVQRVLREGIIVGLANHTLLLARDGTERPIDDSAAPIRDADGTILGVVLIFRDVSEQRQAEQLIRESELRYRLVGNAANDAIWDWNLQTNEVTWNEGVRRVFGFESHEIGADATWWYEHIHPEDRRRVVDGIHAVIDSQESFWTDEYRYARRDGNYAFIFDRGHIVRDAAGNPRRMVGSMLDLTERQKAADALQTLAGELEESNRRKTEFLATLGHELRNPLAPIRTGLELIRIAGNDPEIIDDARSMMERQTLQMVRLIDDLLDVSRISQGKLQLRLCRANLAEIIQTAVEAARPLVDEAGHRLTVTLPGEPIVLTADPTRLAQVVSNLLNNATKYTREGGTIGLTVRRENGEAVITIEDNGIGIPREMQKGIFDMFTQIERPIEKGYRGLGIGLTLVKRLTEMHGGDVAVESEGADRGSRFHVRLPIPLEEQEAPSDAASPQSEWRSGGLRVLVVDDNRPAADTLTKLVRMLGCEAATAYDGDEGIEVAEAFRPDLILMDLGMPKRTGYEAAAHIRQQPWGAGITLVALTGWGQAEDRRRTTEAGFNRHLVKPVEPAMLQRLLRETSAPQDGSGE